MLTLDLDFLWESFAMYVQLVRTRPALLFDAPLELCTCKRVPVSALWLTGISFADPWSCLGLLAKASLGS